ncbi:hypothetical protein O7600_24435 [Micromonospora sp. WMMA1998]|uniref:hypothetical protein n=2 Tax=Micromonospora TaxID=1873 RepID=UPI000C0584E8|nr:MULTISPECIES: hypothetical protein [unclassified Micromonospora]ATO14805.1 hypothetical protein CO540_14030 [Micromonospora sp. WMMA2032]WBC14224.1 hypothetical protein O7600_24435 [Micromonospora sp. WMMA1998]
MTAVARRLLGRLVGTAFGRAVLACLALAGWALWSGGVFDGPVARHVRASSVYAAPGVDLDRTAAERVVGNRRLVVLLMSPGADLREACADTERVTGGTLVLAMSRDGDDWDTYGCSRVGGDSPRDIGRSMVTETVISQGADAFVDRPIEALKVIVLNYDRLVRTGLLPDGARTISPSLPRYLLAGGAVVGVVAGAAALWLGGRRAGRLADARRAGRDARADERAALGAATAVLAQQIIDLDRTGGPGYLRLAGDYVGLLDEVSDPDSGDSVGRLRDRVEELSRRASDLAADAAAGGTAGRNRARTRGRGRR